ncbi:MAG: hypothetical protein DA328_10110 [Nitrososphaeraceae archaeon]|nr:hypothetical protein [Nitrososphaeraceae archaeon]
MSSSKQSNTNGGIAVIGERELVMGYRLLGIEDTFIVENNEEASNKMEDLFSSQFKMIIASQFIRDSLTPLLKAKIESSIEPLVIFMPSLKGSIQEESIASLAKRVLGIKY